MRRRRRGETRSVLRLVLVVAATSFALQLVGSVQSLVAPSGDTGLVDVSQGVWHLRATDGSITSFFFGNPGDRPFVGDWDCDGDDTPGLYRQSDGFVYLRNSNDAGPADLSYFFGNPGDIPLAGDFNNDGCDTVSVYRPSQSRVFIINQLGTSGGGLGQAETSYYFGNPGDKPFVGDFDGDGRDTVGLHRESTGLVYFRNSHTQGNADHSFIFGNPGDRLVAGDWNLDGRESPAVFRPGNTTFYFRHTNTQGPADNQADWGEPDWLPVSGDFQVAGAPAVPPGERLMLVSDDDVCDALGVSCSRDVEVVANEPYSAVEGWWRDPPASPPGFSDAGSRFELRVDGDLLDPASTAVIFDEGIERREWRYGLEFDPGTTVLDARWLWKGTVVFTTIVTVTAAAP